MKRILFLGAPVFQIPVVEKARELGLHVGIVDINEAAKAFPYADEAFVCSIKDKEGVLKIAKDFKPDGVICGACDTSVPVCAYVCGQLGLVGNTEEAAYKSTNKYAMIRAFEENGVPHPDYQFIRKEDIENTSLSMPFPVISKPVDSAGSRGIQKINNEAELRDSLRESSNSGTSGDILVEEYIEGSEVSVEVLVIDGIPHVLQITDKITSGPPHFYETGHSQPSDLSGDCQTAIKRAAFSAVKAVGLHNTPAHVEMKISRRGVKLIELGARMGGDCISTYLINNSIVGTNMSEAAIRLSLGEKIELGAYANSGKTVCVRFIPSTSGIVTEITGLEKASSMPGIIRTEIWCKVGEFYGKANSNSERFGFVLAEGASREETLKKCDNAIKVIEIKQEENQGVRQLSLP